MAKVEKLLKKFGMVFEDKNYYEAHQIARTIYYRWLELEEYQKLTNFLYEKILEFAKVKETTIAFDLTDLYAKTLIKSALPVDDVRLGQIETIFKQVSPLIEPESTAKNANSLLVPPTNLLINWSCGFPENSTIEKLFGNAELNLIFAKTFESIDQLETAKKHYICSKDPQGYAKLVRENLNELIQCQADSETNDATLLDEDALLTLAVLQVLCVGRLGVATKLLHLLTEQYNKYSSRPPYTSPLLNFAWLLTFCVQLKSMEYFTELVETYRPTLVRDSRFLLYVDKVGQKFFGVPAKEENHGGLLGNLLKGMVTKKEPVVDNSAEFVPDDLEYLKEYKITDQGYHAAWEAAASRNPQNSCAEPQYSDALEEQTQLNPTNVPEAQADMDLD